MTNDNNSTQKIHHRSWAEKFYQDLADISIIRKSSFMGVQPWLKDVLTTLFVGLDAPEITSTFVNSEKQASGNELVKMLIFTNEFVALLKVELAEESNHLTAIDNSLSLVIEPKSSLQGLEISAHGAVVEPADLPDWVRGLNVTLRYPSFQETIPYDSYSSKRGIEAVQGMIPGFLLELNTK